jgi:hypothetical protein
VKSLHHILIVFKDAVPDHKVDIQCPSVHTKGLFVKRERTKTADDVEENQSSRFDVRVQSCVWCQFQKLGAVHVAQRRREESGAEENDQAAVLRRKNGLLE